MSGSLDCLVRVVGASKSFAVPGRGSLKALDGVSFEIRGGEIFGLMGLSGAGKSTALRTLNLIERPDQGSVFFEGRDLTQLSPFEIRLVRRKIGMIFQQYHLLSNLTCSENIALPLKVAGWKPHSIRARVRECLDLVGLSDRTDAYPSALSGGQKQRVAIARSIANHPHLLLADEPTSALDPITKNEVIDCLLKINASMGLTIAIATHELEVMRRMKARWLLMQDGAIQEEFRFDDGPGLRAQSAFGKSFLEAI